MEEKELENNQNDEILNDSELENDRLHEENLRLRNNRILEALEVLRSQQNFSFALIGGAFAAFLSAFLWAAITVAAEYQVGYMAIAVGFIVGFSVRFFGGGIDMKFGILGACLSLLGCLLGNLFSQVGFIAHEYSYSYIEVFSLLDFSIIMDVMFESFNPIDILFYGLALYAGYRFSFIKINEDELLQNKGNSVAVKWRMPLVIVAAIILTVVFFVFRQGYTGEKTYTYESGTIMSEGNIKNGKYDGAWTFYYESGNLLSKGAFYKNLRDGDWQWYDENGNLEQTGSYENGLETGVWMTYYENGNVSDSAAYKDGRMNGEYIARYENGEIYQIGNYKLGKEDGLWEVYYENKQLWSKGEMKNDEYIGDWISYFENGTVREETYYETPDKAIIKNRWNADGNQTVKDGDGYYVRYSEDNKTVLLSGEIKNGENVGVWKTYFPNGELEEEGFYEDNTYKIVNAWNNKGEQTVTEGNGKYISYWEDETVYVTGDVKNGLKEGVWHTYNSLGELSNEINYLNGEQHGKTAYYNSGQLTLEGEFANGLKHGEWIGYNENGSCSSSVRYKDDKKEGTQLFYDADGELVKKEKYKNGELVKTEIASK